MIFACHSDSWVAKITRLPSTKFYCWLHAIMNLMPMTTKTTTVMIFIMIFIIIIVIIITILETRIDQ